MRDQGVEAEGAEPVVDRAPAPGSSPAVDEMCPWSGAQRIGDQQGFGMSYAAAVAPAGEVVVAYEGNDGWLWTTAFTQGTWKAATRISVEKVPDLLWHPHVVTAGNARAVLMWQFIASKPALGP